MRAAISPPRLCAGTMTVLCLPPRMVSTTTWTQGKRPLPLAVVRLKAGIVQHQVVEGLQRTKLDGVQTLGGLLRALMTMAGTLTALVAR